MDEHGFLNTLSERLSRLEKDMEEVRQVILTQEATQQHAQAFSEEKTATIHRVVTGEDWEITCFGRFHHRCAGREIPPCRSRRGQAILKCLLASQEHAASTEHLIECFWPRMDTVAGAHNLQMAVYKLRHALQGCGPAGSDETILFSDNRYQLNPALNIAQDADAFRASYQQGQEALAQGKQSSALEVLEQARSFYQGDYFADPYEEWASALRRSLQDMWLTLLTQLGSLYFQAEDWPKAASCYHDMLAVDCAREDISRQLMRCYAAEGRAADIKQTYRLCHECLWEDLRLAPTPETRELYHLLLTQLNASKYH